MPRLFLVAHLNSATSKFRAAVEQVAETVGQKEHHRVFKLRLLANLLSTPWGTENQWEHILQENEPFSKNVTLTNYVPNDFVDDNVFF
jgi:hypothetical protein